MIGQALPEGAAPDGVSFFDVLAGRRPEASPVREHLVVPSGNGTLTIRKGPWKLIQGLGSGGFSKPSRIKASEGGPRGQLYHLNQDPSESINLYMEHPELVKELEQQLKAIQNDSTKA
jgi:arylsulfatase A-like enzyme